MSFPALALAVEAAHNLPPIVDEEFGLSWFDLTDDEVEMDVAWVLYESMGAGVLLRVRSVDVDA